MKIRTDFVTNSSSSGFEVQTDIFLRVNDPKIRKKLFSDCSPSELELTDSDDNSKDEYVCLKQMHAEGNSAMLPDKADPKGVTTCRLYDLFMKDTGKGKSKELKFRVEDMDAFCNWVQRRLRVTFSPSDFVFSYCLDDTGWGEYAGYLTRELMEELIRFIYDGLTSDGLKRNSEKILTEFYKASSDGLHYYMVDGQYSFGREDIFSEALRTVCIQHRLTSDEAEKGYAALSQYVRPETIEKLKAHHYVIPFVGPDQICIDVMLYSEVYQNYVALFKTEIDRFAEQL